MTKIKVMIVDDLDHVRDGLKTILSLVKDIEIVGDACNGAEAISLVGKHHPDIVLMDLKMPKIDGFEATRLIKAQYPQVGIVMMSIHHTPDFQERATQAGGDILLRKGIPTEILIDTIREVWKQKDLKRSK